MEDYLIRGVAAGGLVTFSAAHTTALVERARQIHGLQPLAAAALGRTLTAASMMGDALKSDEGSLTIQIRGDGPLGAITAVSDSRGNVRGYLQNPEAQLPLKASGKLDVGGGVGRGLLTVVKDPGQGEPFSGKVLLRSGEIAEDIAGYYAESEQIPTVCALGVLVDRNRTIAAAGGYLVQLAPGATDELAERLEQTFARLESVTALLSQGLSMEQIMERALEGLEPVALERRLIAYECKCSREKVERALISMGAKELAELAQSGEPIEAGCQFCNAKYVFEPQEIRQLLALSARADGHTTELDG